jgi:large repetitive protein
VSILSADYTYTWYAGPNVLSPLLGAAHLTAQGNQVIGLPAGQYTVQIEEIATGCSSTATYTIFNDLPIVSITAVDLDLDHQFNCSPFDGAATVQNVREDGIPVGTANYTFEWLLADGITPLPGGITADSYGGLAAGTYFVRATSTLSNCIFSLTQFTINDSTSNPFRGDRRIRQQYPLRRPDSQRPCHHRNRRWCKSGRLCDLSGMKPTEPIRSAPPP